MRWRIITYQFCSILIALNYFAFRMELFQDEDSENHPQTQSAVSFTFPTLNWETFDKDNASKAFVFDALIQIQPIEFFPPEHREQYSPYLSFRLIQDKSPPSSLCNI